MSNVNGKDDTDPFVQDNAALIAAAGQYQKDYDKYKADLEYKNKVTLQNFMNAKGFAAFYALLAFLAGDGNGETGPDHTPGGKRADGNASGLDEDRIALNGDSIAVMSALTKCGNDIEKASDSRIPDPDPADPSKSLKQNVKDMDELLDETKAGGLLVPTDPNNSPLDPSLVNMVHEQLGKVRLDIYDPDDKGSGYNPAENRPTSPTDTSWVRTYHLSTDQADTFVSHSYAELYANSQVQGQGSGIDDASKGARDAITNMTNAYQINTNATQTTSSGYNLIANQLSKSDQTILSFLSEICHADAAVKKASVGNQKS